MAWVEQLPSGKYRAVYRDSLGRRRSAGTFTQKSEARRTAAAAEVKARRTLAHDPNAHKMPWSEWEQRWWKARTVEPGTLASERWRVDRHLIPKWGTVALGAITRQSIREWITELQREGLKASNINRTVRLFSVSLSAAVDAEILDANPASRLKLLAEPPAQDVYLTKDEADAVSAQLPTVTDWLIFELLLATGMRWGELAGLHRNRIDFARRTLRVVETFDEKTSTMKAYPKGKKVRDIPIPEWLCIELAKLPVRDTCGVAHRGPACRSGLVLTTPTGSPLRSSNWRTIFNNALDDAKVQHVRIHDIRHTTASWCLQNGVPLAEVGRMFGHTDPKTTQRYAHLAQPPNDLVLAALAVARGNVAPFLPHAGKRKAVPPAGFEPATHGLGNPSTAVSEDQPERV